MSPEEGVIPLEEVTANGGVPSSSGQQDQRPSTLGTSNTGGKPFTNTPLPPISSSRTPPEVHSEGEIAHIMGQVEAEMPAHYKNFVRLKMLGERRRLQNEIDVAVSNVFDKGLHSYHVHGRHLPPLDQTPKVKKKKKK